MQAFQRSGRVLLEGANAMHDKFHGIRSTLAVVLLQLLLRAGVLLRSWNY
jgi:hypothetical protein